MVHAKGKALVIFCFAVGLAAMGFAASADPRYGVVLIRSEFGAEESLQGAGIIVKLSSTEAVILTAAHNLYSDAAGEASSVKVYFYNRPDSYEVVRDDSYRGSRDLNKDLAVLRVRYPRLPLGTIELPLRPTAKISDQEVVIACGHPYELAQDPKLAAPPWSVDRQARLIAPPSDSLQFQSGMVSTGFSGGPVLNQEGEVVGMIRSSNPALGYKVAVSVGVLFAYVQPYFPDRAKFEPTPVLQEALDRMKLRAGRYDYYQVERLIRQAAEDGDELAQAWRALMWATGAIRTAPDPTKGAAEAKRLLPILKQRAAHQDLEAMFLAGRFFTFGLGEPGSMVEAYRFFKLAADGGHPIARAEALRMLLAGQGIPADPRAAIEQMRSEIAAGDLIAGMVLGEAYLYGRGVPEDLGKGFDAMKAPADAGLPAALVQRAQIALMRDPSFGLASIEEARAWLAQAQQQGATEALVTRSLLYYTGRGEPKNFSAMVQLLEEAAELGDTNAMAILGSVARNGVAQKVDLEMAAKWYRRAADARNSNGVLGLAQLYLEGMGVKKDVARGVELLKQATQMQSGDAFALLAYYTQTGSAAPTIPQNEAFAVQHWHQAVQIGSTRGMIGLAMAHRGEVGELARNPGLSETLLARAARMGDFDAMFMFGEYHALNRDFVKAREWYQQALEAGNPMSRLRLGFFAEMGIAGGRDAKLALQHYRAAVDANLPPAKIPLALALLKGIDGSPPDVAGARRLLDEAWQEGVADAGVFLGRVEIAQGGMRPDFAKALDWFTQSAEKGSQEGMAAVAHAMMFLPGNPPNPGKANTWARKLVALGNPRGYGLLGMIAQAQGKLVEAEKHLRTAVEKGDLESSVWVVRFYTQKSPGVYDPAKYDEIQSLLATASEAGIPDASFELGSFEYSARKNPDRAIKALTTAHERGAPGAALLLSKIYREKGDRAASDKWKRIAEQPPMN